MNFIALRTFSNAAKAHLLRSKLESEGIPSFLFDEHMVSLHPLYNQAVQGIKLKVNSFDAEKASEIALYFEKAPHINDHHILTRCPECNSSNLIADFTTFNGIKGIISALISALLVVWPIYVKYVYCCRNCGKLFNQDNHK